MSALSVVYQVLEKDFTGDVVVHKPTDEEEVPLMWGCKGNVNVGFRGDDV